MKRIDEGGLTAEVKWIKLNRYCELTGETRGSVHAKRRRGVFIDGVHTMVVDGNVWVNLNEVEKWIEGKFRPRCRAA